VLYSSLVFNNKQDFCVEGGDITWGDWAYKKSVSHGSVDDTVQKGAKSKRTHNPIADDGSNS
jgi:hypothetical protein